MRVLLIPIEKVDSDVKTGDWHAAIYHILSREHEVVGVVRPRWHTLKGRSKNFVLAWYWLKALGYGLFDGYGLYADWGYDVIYAMNTPSATIGLIVSILRRKPLIWDAGNPALFNPGSLQGMMFLLERLIAKRARGIRMISAPYAGAYRRLNMGKGKTVVIPHLVNLQHIDRALEETRPRKKIQRHKPRLMFMGQGNTPTNVQAIKWLNDVLAPIPDVEIVVTGGKPIAGCDDVTFAGYVTNIYGYIGECDVAVVPIWKESGAPVPTTRVVDFMACGKPVVTTPFLYDEIPELEDGTNVYLAKDEQEFIKKAWYALEHPDEAAEVGKNARKLIEERYTWDIAEQKLEQLLA